MVAQEIYDKYFKAAQAQPRGVVAKLGNIVAQIERACQKQVHYTLGCYQFYRTTVHQKLCCQQFMLLVFNCVSEALLNRRKIIRSVKFEMLIKFNENFQN